MKTKVNICNRVPQGRNRHCEVKPKQTSVQGSGATAARGAHASRCLGMTAAAVALLLLLTPAGCGDDWRYVTVPTSEKQTIRYRGIHMYDEVGIPASEADIDKMGSWGVNLTRWWFLSGALPDNATPAEYQAFIVDRCDHLDTYLEAFERNNIKVCIVMGSYPGGRKDGWVCNMFSNQTMLNTFVTAWKYISMRYKDSETVVMYDLMNEPGIYVPDAIIMIPDLFVQTAEAIRAQGDNTEIIYEPALPTTEYDELEPFDLPGILYSVHVYAPYALTHQGIGTVPIGVAYPDDIDGAYWHKARIRDEFRAVKRFAETYKARIFVGEFGCARWALENGSYNWTKDCLEYFEEEGWEYTFFSLEPTPADCSYVNTAATMWSPEYDTVYPSNCPVESTDRLELLKSYWARNKN